MKQIDWIDEQEKEEADAWAEFVKQRYPNLDKEIESDAKKQSKEGMVYDKEKGKEK